jgi:DnaD/phage-associated family protein
LAPFNGFPEGNVGYTHIPGPFFQELLPRIDHLGELKFTLYFFWRLDRMEGVFRYLRREDFIQDKYLMQAMGETPRQTLDESIQKALSRGTILEATIEGKNGEERLFFLNSPKGRAAVQAINNGEWRPSGDPLTPIEFIQETPNIFQLYEDHIGPLTPMIAEMLREAEDTYPARWIEEGIQIAVENNKRSWRYINAILERWNQEGRNERKNRRDTEKARRRYADWEA